MQTTLNQIRACHPCAKGWIKLLGSLQKTSADDEPLHIRTVLDSNGLDDALWCFRAVAGESRVMRLFAVWCARQVQHLMTDERSIAALDVAERHANGSATDGDLAAAEAAAWHATWHAAEAAAWVEAGDRSAQERELSRVLDCMDAGQDPYPAVERRAAA